MTKETFYRIRRKGDPGTYFKTSRGKTVWTGKGHAKNAWNIATGANYNRNGRPKFDDQDDWELIPVSIVPTRELESLQEDADWLEDLRSAGVDNWGGIDFAHELRRERVGEED